MSAALAPGFTDPVFDSQSVFRAVLSALSRPGLPAPLAAALAPAAPLTPELAAVALALADPDAPLWLDRSLSRIPAVAAYLRFHTGAPIVSNPADAAFALVADPSQAPGFGELATGDDLYPDRSTTLVVAVASFTGGLPMRLRGPGIRQDVTVSASPLPDCFVDSIRANAATFPRGIDCLLVSGGQVVGIPRSSRVVEEAA
jgi:alpha-D-ribose 1-methylphosphonate 5-triphosphate synthase subunit PhnH